MPVDLNSLSEGWLELESDPGLFTLLLEDFGVRGVQVEEIYDLQKPIEGPVYGFIFLFKWIEERRSRRKINVPDAFVQEEETVNAIFFAHQIVPNSCATHALLSVLLNCNKIHLGETLSRLKEYTKNMSPENKGYAIGNTPELAKAHNSHAKPEPRRLHEKSHGIPTGRTVEAFHFVSYVPIGGQLFELDGLKSFPINHGPWDDHEDWTEKFRRVITERLGIATGDEPCHDIRFNLMAVVPDRRIAYEHKLRTLKTNRQIVLEALQHLVKMTNPKLTSDDQAEYMAAVIRSKQQANTSHGFTQENAEQENEALCSSSTIDSLPSSNPTKTNPPPSNPMVSSSAAAVIASHPALDSHNYAKSPLMEGQLSEDDKARPRGSDYTSDEEMGIGNGNNAEANLAVLSSSSTSAHDRALMKPIHVNTKDYSHPLSIQTKFEASPTPSNSSTDTSSEVGSAFNSPVRTLAVGSAQNSPTFNNTRDIKKFVVIRMSSDKDQPDEDAFSSDNSAAKLRTLTSATTTTESGGNALRCDKETNNEIKRAEAFKRLTTIKPSESEPAVKKINVSVNTEAKVKSTTLSLASENLSLSEGNLCLQRHDLRHLSSSKYQDVDDGKEEGRRENTKYPKLIEPHSFAPKDLLALLKNVEHEISLCENNLHEEIEKRKKYKVDDCRRTHNYDRFICTFLKMLAQQGMLADLVRTNVLVKSRQGITVGRLHKKADRRRRTRPKKRK